MDLLSWITENQGLILVLVSCLLLGIYVVWRASSLMEQQNTHVITGNWETPMMTFGETSMPQYDTSLRTWTEDHLTANPVSPTWHTQPRMFCSPFTTTLDATATAIARDAVSTSTNCSPEEDSLLRNELRGTHDSRISVLRCFPIDDLSSAVYINRVIGSSRVDTDWTVGRRREIVTVTSRLGNLYLMTQVQARDWHTSPRIQAGVSGTGVHYDGRAKTFDEYPEFIV